MTYCLALRLDDGLVFMADTRTNAGLDNVSNYRKLHVFDPAPDRLFVLESAGSLATTQQVIDRIRTDLAAPVETESLLSVGHLHEAALYVGRLNREVAEQHRPALSQVGADPTATFILGGQIRGESPELFLVHAEGNYIRVSDERPYLQIGESKYGKFMLDAAVASHVDLVTASKIALGSMMSTARANLSVGPPYDLGIYRNDSLHLEQYRVEPDSPLLHKLEEVWQRHIAATIRDLPAVCPEDVSRIG
jgi:putative proteasome-type protease